MKRRSVLTIAVVVLAALFALWGCPKKAEMSAVPEAQAPERAKEATPEEKEEADKAKERAAAAAAKGLQPIYFDFDQSLIRTEARIAMEENAEWLKTNSRRSSGSRATATSGAPSSTTRPSASAAAAAKKYLTDLGISAGRISLLSYGKEKPICTDHDEGCWQRPAR